MNRFGSVTRPLVWFMALLLVALAAGCGGGGGGGRDPILGGATGVLAPTVTAVAPVNNATGVPITNTIITAQFSEPMAALSPANFTVTCTTRLDGTPCTSPTTGIVALDATNRIATFTLTSAATLDPLTLYTGTITGAKSLATGLALASPYVWKFTTGVTPDTTRPRVLSTFPATGPGTPPATTTGVPTNTAITAIFTEDMAPATITTPPSFTLTCAPACVTPSPAGTVSYAVGSRTATFTLTPAGTLLEAGKTYTAKINGTTLPVATDLAGNALAGNTAALPAASDYVWTFTTAAPVPPGNISVSATHTACPNAVNATFTVPSGLRMDPATVLAGTTFTVTGPSPALTAVAGTVALDAATGTIATFTPTAALIPGSSYTLTITGGASGVKDLAVPANTLNMNPYTLTFSPGPATGACTVPVPLNSAAPFGIIGGSAGMTNAGNLTVIDGDIGTIATGTSSITGFHDSATPVPDSYTETCPGTPLLATGCGLVTGRIYTCTVSSTGPTSAIAIGPATQNPVSCGIATQGLLDAGTAYGALAALAPGGASPAPGANLGSLTLLPGVYTAPAGSFLIQGGDLTLDAGGNANAVWVFKMASTLTVGGPGAAFPQSIILAGGAQAKNVFWQVGTSAVINAAGGGTMVGTIITGGSPPGIAISTSGNAAPVTLNGRAITTTVTGASVTVVNTLINVPAP